LVFFSIRSNVVGLGECMAELRQEHLGIPAGPAPDASTVHQRLQDAYPAVVVRNSAV
jgi:hypothetical protein